MLIFLNGAYWEVGYNSIYWKTTVPLKLKFFVTDTSREF